MVVWNEEPGTQTYSDEVQVIYTARSCTDALSEPSRTPLRVSLSHFETARLVSCLRHPTTELVHGMQDCALCETMARAGCKCSTLVKLRLGVEEKAKAKAKKAQNDWVVMRKYSFTKSATTWVSLSTASLFPSKEATT